MKASDQKYAPLNQGQPFKTASFYFSIIALLTMIAQIVLEYTLGQFNTRRDPLTFTPRAFFPLITIVIDALFIIQLVYLVFRRYWSLLNFIFLILSNVCYILNVIFLQSHISPRLYLALLFVFLVKVFLVFLWKTLDIMTFENSLAFTTSRNIVGLALGWAVILCGVAQSKIVFFKANLSMHVALIFFWVDFIVEALIGVGLMAIEGKNGWKSLPGFAAAMVWGAVAVIISQNSSVF